MDPVLDAHVTAMRAAIGEAERARGTTGDNPWVGCVITDARGAIIARGHTQGPGEDHAEIVAMHEARVGGVDLTTSTLYSTLEPCAFHGRTPACARAVVDAGVRRVVVGILDPNPRVDGVGLSMLREAGVEVVADVCAVEISHQLAPWIFLHHPHEPLRRALALSREHGSSLEALVPLLRAHYGIDLARAEALARAATKAV
jgi:diaminohydroxyphosphoribosylaminopyrimidine deaminase / 5-amino-6-(5-phosphoribosylamino)uracil reductase